VTEYTPGTDAAVDQQILSLIDRWAAGKSTVNPYIYTVRECLSSGLLSAEHRVFLTNVDEILRAAVIVTRMQSEAGYLLDVEFYGDDMPLGGLEYTIVRIIEVLQAERVRIFSFGATFGIKICQSPNTSTEAEQALQELRSVGMLGMGNYRFKKKFQPAEFPVYLCQPAAERTAVSDILLMIADPNQVRDAEPNQSTTLAAVEWNPLRLPHSEIEIDLLTDSWAEREDPWISERMRLLAQPWANAQATTDLIEQWWLPYTLTIPMPSGRAAEALLCRAWPGRRGTVLHNGLFPTLSFNLADQRFKPVAITRVDDRENGASGDLHIPSLKEALADKRGEVSLIAIELSVNAGAGWPISLANLKQVRALADSFGIPLLLDATRIVENALWITECEPDLDSREPWTVISELLALADVATFSLSKDFAVNFGGLVASRIPELNERLKEQIKLRGMDVGLLSRRTLQRVLSDSAVVLEKVRERMAAARALWQRLSEAGLPVVTPVGGHCVLLDVGRLPAFAGYSHPITACLSWIYEHTGIRGGPHLSGGGAYTVFERCIRLAIPINMTVEAAGRAGEKLAALLRRDDQPYDLELITEPGRGLEEAGYRLANRVQDVVPVKHNGWFAQQLRELGTTLRSSGYTPADQNREVLLELVPAADCLMVTIPEGVVEVFSVGAGPVLLLLHPFNIGVGMFAYQLAELSDRFRIIVMHQPGIGRTRAEGSLSLEGIANLQRRVLSELGVNEAVHIGGASVGAIFAQYFALRFPEQTLSLSLIGGSYRFANRKGQIDKLEQVIAEDFDMIIAGSGSTRIDEEREHLTRLLLRCESMDPHTGLRYLDLFAREPELTTRLGEIKVPTLVLQGRHDSVVGVKTGHFLHGAIPNARYVELPESGHFICFTDPQAVNRELAAFLQGDQHRLVTPTSECTRQAVVH
jgi:tryptophanase/pimeloyl-ACP methyl ester carboxylesterase